MENNKNINFDQYDIGREYNINGVQCIYDPIREKLIVSTPEEVVRQKFIRYMIEVMQVPKNRIDIEVPLSRFKPGTKGRADIVIFGELIPEENVPILIVECKAPSVPIFDEVWYQVDKYDEVLGAGYVIVTNSIETYAGRFNKQLNFYDLLQSMPTYQDLLNGEGIIDPGDLEPWHRPKFEELLSEENIQMFKDDYLIGEDTPRSLYPLIMNLGCFLLDSNIKLLPNPLEGFNVIEEGIRYSTFGNAGGGGYDGLYRYLLIKGKNKNDLIVSFGVFGTGKTVNDPFWGNRVGYTSLVVGTNYNGKEHSSLQLNIDKRTKINDDTYELWHDGTLTIGRIGSAKRNDVIEFIRSREPALVNSNNAIVLGKIFRNKHLLWEQEETRKFFSNLIRYALLRDEYRAIRLKDHKLKNKKLSKRKK